MDEKLQEIVGLQEQGYRATAMRQLTQYLRANPEDAEAWYMMAKFSNQPRRQKAALERALKLRPDYPQAKELRSVLLEENPSLGRTREYRIAFIAFFAVLAVGVLGVMAGATLFEPQEQELRIVVPTTEVPPPTVPAIIIVTNTPTAENAPTQTLAPTQTPEPTANIPTPAPVSSSPSQRIVLAEFPDVAPFADRLRLEFPSLDVQIAEASVTNPTDAARLAGERGATLVIYRDEAENWALYADEGSAPLSAIELSLDRLPDPWELHLNSSDPNSADSLEAALSYLIHDHQGVLDRLATLFDTPRSQLDADGAELAFMLAYAYQASGEPSEALRLYDMLNQDEPPPYVVSNRAYAIAQAGDPESAIILYTDLLEQHPDPVLIQTNIGQLYGAESQEAFTTLEAVIETQPNDPRPHYARAQLLMERGDWEAARGALDEALALGLNSADAHADLALIFYQLGSLDSAQREAEGALLLDADNPRAKLALGQVYLALNEITPAVNQFSEGLAVEPENLDLLVGRCTAYGRMGDDGAAAADCDTALSLDNQNAAALEQRGMIRYRAGDRTGAEEDFREAISYEPGSYEAHYHLGFFALQERRFGDAIDELSTAIDLAPFLGKAFAARGVAYRLTANWAAAVEDLDRAVQLMPEEVYSYYELGLANRALADLAFESGAGPESREYYQAALNAFTQFLNASQPEDPFVSEALAGLNYVQSALNVVQP